MGIVKRYDGNPVLKPEDIPGSSSQVYNAGVAKYQGEYVMAFRNDVWEGGEFKYTNIGKALSKDGLAWQASETPCFSLHSDEIMRAYDPRLTVIEDKCYMCFAADTRHGIQGGIAVTEDFRDFKILSLSVPDNRNMVLFPGKINGKYARLERPFPVYGRAPGQNESFDIWISYSPDLVFWGESRLLLGAEQVPYANCKIGPAAPPILTDKGWLALFHAVYKDESKPLATTQPKEWGPWCKTYYAGLVLLDRDNPSKIIGMHNEPLMTPETEYELKGFRGSVIFPGGMIHEENDEVKIYYGAADTVEALAFADINELLTLCAPV